MADPIGDIIGDYRTFSAQQRDRLAVRGIDITPYGLSHLAYRVPGCDQYVHVRGLIERHAVANHENVWNGRPISLIVLAEPLEVLDGKVVPLIDQLEHPASHRVHGRLLRLPPRRPVRALKISWTSTHQNSSDVTWARRDPARTRAWTDLN